MGQRVKFGRLERLFLLHAEFKKKSTAMQNTSDIFDKNKSPLPSFPPVFYFVFLFHKKVLQFK